MTIKERVIRRIEKMDEAQLGNLEKQLEGLASEDGGLSEEFRLLNDLAAPMSEEDRRIFEEASRRRPFFSERRTSAETDDA